MANKTGNFGQEFFGAGYFGAQTAYAALPLFLAPADWENIFTQAEPAEMVIGVKVYRNGTAVSLSDVDRFSTQASEDRFGATAELSASLGSGYAAGDLVQITCEFTPATGSPFEIPVYSGFVSSVLTGLSTADDEELVTVYLTSSQHNILDAVPEVASWNGSASSLLEYAFFQIGCTSIDIDIDDYAINQSFVFSTWRDLIKAVASGLSAANAGITSAGVGFARAWDHTATIYDSVPTGFLIPRTGWTVQQAEDTSTTKYRSVTVQGVGSATGSAVDPAGVGVDYSESSNLLTTASQCAAKAQSILDLSSRTTRSIQAPINPALKIGALIRTATVSGTVSGKILSISHAGEWSDSSGGFWTTLAIGIDA